MKTKKQSALLAAGVPQQAENYAELLGLFPGLKGRVLTTAISTFGYAEDSQAFLDYYDANKDAIDPYLAQIDVGKALSRSQAVRGHVVSAVVGGVIGAGIGYWAANRK